MKKIAALLLLLFTFCINSSFAQSRDISYLTSGGKLRPLQAIMDIRHYTIALNVDIPKQSIAGYTETALLLLQKTDTLLFDLVHLLTVYRVMVDHKAAAFVQKGDSLLIINNKGFSAKRHLVKINYGGVPPVAVRPPWLGGFTWAKDKTGNPWVVINCQLQGAKLYFPCKDHPSDEADDGADLLITIPKGLSVAGPGLLKEVKTNGDHTTWHWKTNYTISNYCIVFNIGQYKVVSRPYVTVSGHTVPIQFYVLQEDAASAQKVIDIRERDTKVLEKYFGEYPWVNEKIGIAEVPNPGMEHQTMITYGDHFKYNNYRGLEFSSNLFHEFAHEWWANKITNKDWADMWIQEGIATYAEALFFKDKLGESAYDSVMLHNRAGIANNKPVVQGDGLSMNEIYNGDIYNKGAFLMHTLRYVLGDSVFFPALKKFITDVKYPYHQFFTTADVQQFFCERSGRDLNPLFDFYLRTTKTLDIELYKIAPDTYSLIIKNSPMELPLDVIIDSGIIQIKMTTGENKPIKLTSKTWPVADPRGWYFKKVVLQ